MSKDDQRLKESVVAEAKRATMDAREHWDKDDKESVSAYIAYKLSSYTKKMQREIGVLECLLKEVEAIPATLSTRRVIVGIKAAIAQRKTNLDIHKHKIETGLELEHDDAGSLTREEKKVLRTHKKNLAAIIKYHDREMSVMGRGRDSDGYKVGGYQQSEISLVEKFIREQEMTAADFKFGNLGTGVRKRLVQELLKEQRQLDVYIASNRGKVNL